MNSSARPEPAVNDASARRRVAAPFPRCGCGDGVVGRRSSPGAGHARSGGQGARDEKAAATPRDGHEVPFYLQPWLGGAQSVRGYRTFRVRDRSALLLQAEYRWRVNELVTGALFYDTGAVARTLGTLGRLDDSYGAGLRVGGRMGSALRLDVAFGSREGRRILVRFDDVF